MPSCPENAVALLLYRLVITNALFLNIGNAVTAVALKCFSEQLYDPPDVRTAVALGACCDILF